MTWMVVRSVYVLCVCVNVSGTLVRKDPGRCFLACYNKHVCTIIIIFSRFGLRSSLCFSIYPSIFFFLFAFSLFMLWDTC